MTAIFFDVADMFVAGNALNLVGIYMFISAYSYAQVQHIAHHAFQAKTYPDEKCSTARSMWRRVCTILLFCFIAAPVATFSCARGTNWISLYNNSGTLFAHGLQLMPNSAPTFAQKRLDFYGLAPQESTGGRAPRTLTRLLESQ